MKTFYNKLKIVKTKITENHFFVWLVPIIWMICSVLSYRYPGDEYSLWAISSAPGMLFESIIRFGLRYDINMFLPIVFTGSVIMAAIGYLSDKLQINKELWIILLLAVFAGFFTFSMISEEALNKNGSWAAYFLCSLNVGLYLSMLVSIIARLILSLEIKIGLKNGKGFNN